jgi:hypothetical protein
LLEPSSKTCVRRAKMQERSVHPWTWTIATRRPCYRSSPRTWRLKRLLAPTRLAFGIR